jgi:hypothetical protein
MGLPAAVPRVTMRQPDTASATLDVPMRWEEMLKLWFSREIS